MNRGSVRCWRRYRTHRCAVHLLLIVVLLWHIAHGRWSCKRVYLRRHCCLSLSLSLKISSLFLWILESTTRHNLAATLLSENDGTIYTASAADTDHNPAPDSQSLLKFEFSSSNSTSYFCNLASIAHTTEVFKSREERRAIHLSQLQQ